MGCKSTYGSPPGDITRMAPAFETINETTAAFDCRRSESDWVREGGGLCHFRDSISFSLAGERVMTRHRTVSRCLVSKKDDYVWVSKEDRYYQTLKVTIYLTDPYIVDIATIVNQLFCSWSEGEERERGREVWGKENKTEKSLGRKNCGQKTRNSPRHRLAVRSALRRTNE